MKREYEKPVVEMIEFKLTESIMGEVDLGGGITTSGEGVDDVW